jgi:hypothetical protein
MILLDIRKLSDCPCNVGYGSLGGSSTILDTITTNPMNPSLAYKNFSALYIDYIWMQKNNSSFDIYYKRNEKQKNVGTKILKRVKVFL